MNENTRRFRDTLLAAGLAMAVLAAPALLLAEPQGPDGWGPPRGNMLGHLAERLDLEEGQQVAFEELMTAHFEAQGAQHKELWGRREALNAAVEAEIFDENTIRAAAAEVAALEADQAVARAALGLKLREILTPEQMEQLEEMRRQRGRFSHGPHEQKGPSGGHRGFETE